jgi:NADH dehydrogenase
MGQVEKINFKKNSVSTDMGEIDYDYLIVASGSRADFFGIKGAETSSFVLKTLEHAMDLRNHILTCFEKANTSDSPDEKKRLLTFVIAGGGATGVEFAGAFAELVKGPIDKDFPNIRFNDVSIVLVEAEGKLLSGYSSSTSSYVISRLGKKGVKVMLNSPAARIDSKGIYFSDGNYIEAATVLWTAGVSGFDIPADISPALTHNKRIKVNQLLQIPGYENVFACGDIAAFTQNNEALPMLAPVATQQGVHTAKNILAMLEGKEPEPFKYTYKGSMIVVGRNIAVTKIGDMEIKGFFAWVLWLFIHIAYLIGFRNKIFVLVNWFTDYIFYERAGRIVLPSCDLKNHESVKKKSKGK